MTIHWKVLDEHFLMVPVATFLGVNPFFSKTQSLKRVEPLMIMTYM
jgi:hypothetical protein